MKKIELIKRPKKDPKFNITIRKITLSLVMVLIAIAALRTNSVGNLEKKLIDSLAAISVLKFNDWANNAELNQVFSEAPFCGWQVNSAGQISSSKDYENTSLKGEVTTRKIAVKGIDSDVSVCIAFKDAINSKTKRNMIFLLVLGTILFLLIFNDKHKVNPKDEQEIKQSQ